MFEYLISEFVDAPMIGNLHDSIGFNAFDLIIIFSLLVIVSIPVISIVNSFSSKLAIYAAYPLYVCVPMLGLAYMGLLMCEFFIMCDIRSRINMTVNTNIVIQYVGKIFITGFVIIMFVNLRLYILKFIVYTAQIIVETICISVLVLSVLIGCACAFISVNK